MNWVRSGVIGMMLVALAQACSAGERLDVIDGAETAGETTQAITTACSFDTLGLPCDPDGPAGTKLECEGMCVIARSGYVTCSPVAAGSMNGIVCGTTSGVGNGACKRYCSGKSCIAASAPAGAGCRPTSGSTPCDGQCDGAGVCNPIANPCEFGRQGQLCKQLTCDLAKATQCLTKNLIVNTSCSDTDACSIGRCSSKGVCVAGPTLGCNDGNDCTDDSCDPNEGGCLGTNDDTNACSDGDACTTGEYCSNGSCVRGTTPVDCDDANLCTGDSCDPNTGCAHIPKSCDDSDACTNDTCDPTTGGCISTNLTCDDANPCTNDSCDPAKGCIFTPVGCDDANACTADSCVAGDCQHLEVSCDDGDACTNDTCDTGSGCVHEPISGCGGGGSGGNAGSGGTSSGGSDAGGAASAGADSGGADEGGAAAGGAAGAPNAGTDAGGSNSEAGAAGAAEAGGSSPTGGAATGGNPSGGSGTNNTAGTSSIGGAPAGGGSSASGGNGETGGSSATGGNVASAGEDGAGNQAGASGDGGGCGCRVGGQSTGGSFAWALGLAGAVTLWRRRRAA